MVLSRVSIFKYVSDKNILTQCSGVSTASPPRVPETGTKANALEEASRYVPDVKKCMQNSVPCKIT